MKEPKDELEPIIDPNYISDEEWDNPKPLSEADLKLHQENTARMIKYLKAFLIAKIGILTLIAVILYKFFRKD